MSDLDGGLAVTFRPRNKKWGRVYFQIAPRSWFFFLGLRTTGRLPSRFWSLVTFFLVSLDPETLVKKATILEQNLAERFQCTSGQNLQNRSHLIKRRSDPRFGVWPETQGMHQNLFLSLFASVNFASAFFRSPPRERARRGLSESPLLFH